MNSQLFLSASAVLSIAACTSFNETGSSIPKTTSEKQMLGLIEKFDRWDYNGDGLLTAKEIDDGISSLKGTSRSVNYTAEELIKFYDQNGDKAISLKEAQEGYRRKTQKGANPLQ